MSAYLLSFLGQWGPAVYLCYKVGLAKANTLVYEAGEWPFCPSYPLTLHSSTWCLVVNVSDPQTDFPLPSSPSLGSSSFLTWNLTDRFTLMGAFLLGYRAAGPLPTRRQ